MQEFKFMLVRAVRTYEFEEYYMFADSQEEAEAIARESYIANRGDLNEDDRFSSLESHISHDNVVYLAEFDSELHICCDGDVEIANQDDIQQRYPDEYRTMQEQEQIINTLMYKGERHA